MLFARLFRGGCAALTIAMMLSLVCWAASYRWLAHAQLPVNAGEGRCAASSYRGVLSLVRVEDYPAAEGFSQSVRHVADRNFDMQWDAVYWTDSWAGFSLAEGLHTFQFESGESVNKTWTGITLPYWMITTLLALVPAWELLTGWRSRRRVVITQPDITAPLPRPGLLHPV